MEIGVGVQREADQRASVGAHLLPSHFRHGTSIYRTFIMIHLNNQSFGCLLWTVNLSFSEQFLKQSNYFLWILFCQCLKQSKLEVYTHTHTHTHTHTYIYTYIYIWKKNPGVSAEFRTLLQGKKTHLFQQECCMPACLASSLLESG